MLNKEQYLAKLNAAVESLGFDKREVCIVYGGASLLHDLRKTTNDVDVEIPVSYWNLLIENGCEVKVLPAVDGLPETKQITYMDVDFHILPVGKERRLVIMHGYGVVNRLQLLRDRIAYGREKDVGDIYKLKAESRFLTACDRSRMWSIQSAYRGTATA